MFRALIAALFILISTSSNSEIIKRITIDGLMSLSRGTLLSYLPVEVGDEYLESFSDKIIQSIYKSQFVKDINVGFNDGELKIKIIENPTISYFEVKGYKNDKVLNEKRLELALEDLKLSTGNIFNPKSFSGFLKKLKDQYNSSGYYDAKIEESLNIDSNNRLGVEINIDEGKVAKIKSFVINGSVEIESEELYDLFEIGEPDFFLLNFWTEKDHFSQFDYDAGIEKLKSFYFNKGYLEFSIKEENVSFSEIDNTVDIKISINEGPQYKVNEINFSGDYLNIPQTKLSKLFGINKGDLFLRKNVVNGLEKINDFFANQGFAYTKVNANTIDNKENHYVDLSIDIFVNERVYVNRITISGNTRTQDSVIRRHINLLEGQQYSVSELEKSTENIKRLGFFTQVDMKTTKDKEFPDKLNIHFIVEENKTGQFSIGLSQSNTTGAAFNLGIEEKNFLGTGNTLNANLTNSEAVEEISFYFKNPNFNDTTHSISYGITSKTVNSQYIDLNSYTLNENSISGSYGIPISEYGIFTNGFRMANLDLQCGTVYSIYEAGQCSSGDNKTLLSLISNLSENSLNDSVYPSDGLFNNLNIEIATPLGDLNYYKFDARHESYYPLENNLVFKLSSQLGLIDSYSEKETPFFNRYFGGGASSIRGFEINSLGPTYSNGSAKGGELSFLTTTSLISPLPIDDSQNMRIGVFAEIGSIHESISNIDSEDLRASTGLAFSWYTPIGPIGVFWSKPLLKKPNDRLETFAFSLGSAF